MSRYYAGFNELANPTVWPTSLNSTMPYPGGGFSNGVSNDLSGIGSSMPGINISLDTSFLNTGNNQWNDAIRSEIPVNQQYYVDHGEGFNDTGAKQFIWTVREPGTRGGSTHARSYKHIGWSMLNQKLHYDPAFLNAYGNEPDCKKFLNDFDWLGVQAGQQPDYQEANAQIVQTYHMNRRARVICPHVILQSPSRESVNELDVLYAVMKRYPLVDELASQLALSNSINSGSILGGKRLRLERADERLELDAVRRKMGYGLEEKEQDEDMLNQKEQKYYWRIEPYTSHENADPPLSAYSYAGNSLDFMRPDEAAYTGCFWRLGTVHKLEGACDWTPKKAAVAHEFLYPSSTGEAYKKAGNQLPDVIIQLRV